METHNIFTVWNSIKDYEKLSASLQQSKSLHFTGPYLCELQVVAFNNSVSEFDSLQESMWIADKSVSTDFFTTTKFCFAEKIRKYLMMIWLLILENKVSS